MSCSEGNTDRGGKGYIGRAGALKGGSVEGDEKERQGWRQTTLVCKMIAAGTACFEVCVHVISSI